MTHLVGNWYISSSVMMLATMLAIIPVLFCLDSSCQYGIPAAFYVAGTHMCRSFNLFEQSIIRQFDSHTDSRALRAEYCIVGIPHSTAI